MSSLTWISGVFEEPWVQTPRPAQFTQRESSIQ